MKRNVYVFLAALAALVWSMALPAYAQTAAPSITAVSAEVAAGQIIRFSGSGFIGGERVAFWVTAPNQAVLGGYFTFAQDDGTVWFEFRAPEDAIGGTWAMTAFGLESKTPAVATFNVQGRVATAADQAAWSAPNEGVAGTRFAFAATGFRRGEYVSYWFTGPDGLVYDAHPGGVRADANGRIDMKYTSHEPAGTWVVTFQGLRSGITRGVPFEVRASTGQ